MNSVKILIYKNLFHVMYNKMYYELDLQISESVDKQLGAKIWTVISIQIQDNIYDQLKNEIFI